MGGKVIGLSEEIDEATLKHLIVTDAWVLDRLTDVEFDPSTVVARIETSLREYGLSASRDRVEACLARLRSRDG